MDRPLTALLCLTLAVLACSCNDRGVQARNAVRLLCAAGLRPALDELLPAFTEDSGIIVEPDYAGSVVILARARTGDAADLFLPGDSTYVDELQKQLGNLPGRADIAYLIPCIIVAKGNPKKVLSLQDLCRDDVRVAVGNPEACQVGRVTAALLQKAGVSWAGREPKQGVTVAELGVWVKMGDVDAAVVWDATAADLREAVDSVAIPVDASDISRVTLALLPGVRNPEAARQFMRFCTYPRGKGILRRKGYSVDLPGGQEQTEAAPGAAQ